MPRLPRVTPKKTLKALKKAGFYVDRTTGSHAILYKDDTCNPVTIPLHNKDLKTGTLSSILKQAKLSVQDFVDLL